MILLAGIPLLCALWVVGHWVVEVRRDRAAHVRHGQILDNILRG